MLVNKKILTIFIISLITIVNLSNLLHSHAYNNLRPIFYHSMKSTDKKSNSEIKVNYCSSSMIRYKELKKEYKLLAEAEKKKDIDAINNAFQKIQRLYVMIGNYQKALEYCQALKELGIKYKNNSMIYFSYFYSAQIYDIENNLELALVNYFKTFKYSPNEGYVAIVYCFISQIYQNIKNIDLAIFYAKTAERIADKQNNFTKYYVQMTLWGIYYDQKRYKLAIKTLENALSKYKSPEILKYQYSSYCCNLGISYYKLGDYDKALFYLRKSINKTNNPSKKNKIQGLYWLGYVYLKQHKYQKAVTYFNKADSLNAIKKNSFYSNKINKGFYELYSAENKIDKAYKHLVLYQKAKYKNYVKLLKTSALISSNKYINKQVSMLKEDISLKNQKLHMANFTNLLLIIISSLVAVLLSLFFFLYSSKKKHGKELMLLNDSLDKKIKERKKELRESFSKLRNEVETRKEIESEIKIAAEVQHSILPNITSKYIRPEFTLYAALEAAKDAAGDFYDFFYLDDGRLALVLADVSGKGITAALFMAFAKTVLRNICPGEKDPSEALIKANKILVTDNIRCMFVTVFLCYYNIDTGELIYANAGHHEAIILNDRPDINFSRMKNLTKRFDKLSSAISLNTFGNLNNIPLGVIEDATYISGNKRLNFGDSVICYTDGVSEAISPEEEEYGEERLYKLLKKNRSLKPSELSNAIIKDVKDFEEGNRFDDITVLIFKRNKL